MKLTKEELNQNMKYIVLYFLEEHKDMGDLTSSTIRRFVFAHYEYDNKAEYIIELCNAIEYLRINKYIRLQKERPHFSRKMMADLKQDFADGNIKVSSREIRDINAQRWYGIKRKGRKLLKETLSNADERTLEILNEMKRELI